MPCTNESPCKQPMLRWVHSSKCKELVTQQKLLEVTAQKDGAYAERNKVLVLLAATATQLGWRVGVGRHPESDTKWEKDWRTILFIDLPTGQASWHFHDSEAHLLSGFPEYPDRWDGHTTEEKYERVLRARLDLVEDSDWTDGDILNEVMGPHGQG